TISVIPAALGDTSAAGFGSGFVTYDATVGVRLLNASEFASTFTSGSQTLNNVRLGAALTLSAPTQVNPLELTTGRGLTLHAAPPARPSRRRAQLAAPAPGPGPPPPGARPRRGRAAPPPPRRAPGARPADPPPPPGGGGRPAKAGGRAGGPGGGRGASLRSGS